MERIFTNALKKQLRRRIKGDLYVHVETQTCKEVLLGMDEEDFIRLAKVLPPRTTNKDED